jgi:hypothetical protein
MKLNFFPPFLVGLGYCLFNYFFYFFSLDEFSFKEKAFQWIFSICLKEFIHFLTISKILQKNISGALKVLKHIQDANLKPDSQTFSYLFTNCDKQEDINKVSWV